MLSNNNPETYWARMIADLHCLAGRNISVCRTPITAIKDDTSDVVSRSIGHVSNFSILWFRSNLANLLLPSMINKYSMSNMTGTSVGLERTIP